MCGKQRLRQQGERWASPNVYRSPRLPLDNKIPLLLVPHSPSKLTNHSHSLRAAALASLSPTHTCTCRESFLFSLAFVSTRETRRFQSTRQQLCIYMHRQCSREMHCSRIEWPACSGVGQFARSQNSSGSRQAQNYRARRRRAVQSVRSRRASVLKSSQFGICCVRSEISFSAISP